MHMHATVDAYPGLETPKLDGHAAPRQTPVVADLTRPLADQARPASGCNSLSKIKNGNIQKFARPKICKYVENDTVQTVINSPATVSLQGPYDHSFRKNKARLGRHSVSFLIEKGPHNTAFDLKGRDVFLVT